MTNETTRLLAQTSMDADSIGSLSRFDSFTASARSMTKSVTQSMKRIGILGSVAIAANSLTGPAMLCLPATYQKAGLIPTTGTRSKIDSDGTLHGAGIVIHIVFLTDLLLICSL